MNEIEDEGKAKTSHNYVPLSVSYGTKVEDRNERATMISLIRRRPVTSDRFPTIALLRWLE